MLTLTIAEPEATEADRAPVPLDMVWQGLELLLRHILAATEKLQWDLSSLAEQPRRPPDMTQHFEDMQAFLRAERQAAAALQEERLSGLRRQIADLAAITDGLVDSTLDQRSRQDAPFSGLEEAIHGLTLHMTAALANHEAQIERLGAKLDLTRQRPEAPVAPALPDPQILAKLQALERGQSSLLARLDREVQDGARGAAQVRRARTLRRPRSCRALGQCCGD